MAAAWNSIQATHSSQNMRKATVTGILYGSLPSKYPSHALKPDTLISLIWILARVKRPSDVNVPCHRGLQPQSEIKRELTWLL